MDKNFSNIFFLSFIHIEKIVYLKFKNINPWSHGPNFESLRSDFQVLDLEIQVLDDLEAYKLA